jgi:hypothetical protein
MKLSPRLLLLPLLALFGLIGVAQIGAPDEPTRERSTPADPRQLTPESFVGPRGEPVSRPTLPHRYDGPGMFVGDLPNDDTLRPDEPMTFTKGGPEAMSGLPQGFLGDPYFLGFAGGFHRPPAGEKLDPELVRRIVMEPRSGEDRNFAFGYVMFQGRITDAKLEQVRRLGVTLFRYHPNNCYGARIPTDQVVALSELEAVHWVGVARSEQKIHPVLLQGLQRGGLRNLTAAGEVPVFVNLFQSELNERSVRVSELPPTEADQHGEAKPGAAEAATYSWKTNGRFESELERLGLRIVRYWEQIDAYEGLARPGVINELVQRDWVSFVEWSPPIEAGHDRHVPQMGQDYFREAEPVTVQTVGVIDSGFHLANGGFGGHQDLNKWAVGWNHWSGGGCGSPFCDEASEGYHGTHVLGTISGSGSVLAALKGMSPYLGTGTATHRIFLAKCFCYTAFQNMRTAYTDGSGFTTPRPVAISNSWRSFGCVGSPGAPANYVGSESGARTTDDEVFTQNQLYVFCSGNEGECNGGCGVAGTLGIPSVAKNALTVGAVQDFVDGTGDPGVVTCWSSRGPCGDGRWKPNVVATGCNTTSTAGGTTDQYSTKCGCSMATPTTTGIVAGVLERNADPRGNAALARAWIMATANPWQGQTGTSAAHRNAYGLGRVSSNKAHTGGGSLPWTRTWFYGTVGSTTPTWDFTVGADATRLVLVLTWDDPQSSAGANPAVVKDVDLWLDLSPFTAPGNSGEWTSQTVVNTVEHIVIDNPTAGSYRMKVYPFNTSNTVRFGVLAIEYREDPTPVHALTASVSDAFVKPGETVDVTLTGSTPQYLASNVYLDKGTHTGMTFTGTSTTLKDGVVLTDRHDANGDSLFGDILTGSSRNIVYSFTAGAGNAVRTINFSSRSDNAGTDSVAPTVTVDGTPPPLPTGLASTTHTINQWSNNRTVTFTWTQPADNLSGMSGYGEAWGTTSPVFVAEAQDFASTTTRTVNFTSDFTTLYYAIKPVDRSGNWNAGIAEAGPYRIDTVEPALVTNLTSTSHTTGVWSNDPTLVMTWTAATDDRSGVSGYSRSLTTLLPGLPDTIQDIGAVTTDSLSVGTGGGRLYNIRTRDNAGNWSATAPSAGPYMIDLAAPVGPSALTSPTHTVNVWSNASTVIVNWTAATDAHSGLAGYASLWDQSPLTDPTVVNLAAGAITTSRALASSATGHWLHLRARDNAGNYGTTQHIGPFLIDATRPSGPTGLASSTHTPNVWSNVANVTMNWTAATDAHSGLAGYASLWDAAAGTTPAGPLNLGAGAVTQTAMLSSSAAGQYFHILARDQVGNPGAPQHSGPYLIDLVAPNGVTLTIDSGNPDTPSFAVNLAITGSDAPSGVDAMRFRNDGGVFSAWEPFAAAKAWNLTNDGGASTHGTRTVVVEVRDRAGNVSSNSDTIYKYVATTYVGSSCAGAAGLPTFVASGVPGIGRTVNFIVGNTTAPVLALYLGFSNTLWNGLPLPLDLALYGVPGCFVNSSWEALLWQGPVVPIPVGVPNVPALAGVVTWWQGVLLGDPGGRLVVTTQSARVEITGL